jgi:MOSC domain-containing protein YiiM
VSEVVSVNVGRPRLVQTPEGRTVKTSIWKAPVEGRVAVRGVNVEGDDQSDREVHGGPDKAVYSYAAEDYEWWSGELGRELGRGTFGENLTLRGVAIGDALIGERWQVGSVVLEVSEPRFPCFKLGLRMGDPRFLKRFAAARRPGAYLRIVEEGELGAGDEVRVLSRPGHDVTIALHSEAYLGDRSLLARLLEAPQLSAGWRSWIEGQQAAQPAG